MRRGPAVLCVALMAAASPCLAFDGRVVRSDGSPVADATVSVLGRPGATRTDREGRFTWTPDPVPPFRVLVILPGGMSAAPVTVPVIPSEGFVTVQVEPIALESISVTAEAAPHTQSPPAAAMSLIGREDLEQRHPQRLTDAIENVPGVGRLGSGHDAVPSIRGLARGRTLILVDGARVSTERRAGPSAGFVDPYFLDSLEVSRGPGSVAYGSDALGGVIHARTRRAAPGSPLRVRFTGDAGVGMPQWGAGIELSRGLEEGGVVLIARHRRFGDYDSARGEIGNSSASESGILARFDHEAGPGALSLGWQSDEGRGIERPSASSFLTSAPREDSHRFTFSYHADPLPGATLLGVSGYLGSYRIVTQRDAGTAASLSRSDVRARDAGLRATATRPVGGGRIEGGIDVNGRLGLEAIDRVGSSETRAIEDARRVDAAVYASGEAPLSPRLVAAGGVRVDRVTTRNRGGVYGDLSTGNGAWSGYASLTAEATGGFSVTGQIARGFRDPSLSDRYFVGTSGRGVVTGEPDLDPETSLQYDLVLRWKAGRWSTALYAYDYRIADLIERYASPSGSQEFRFRNRGEARLRGLEAEARADLGRGASVEIGASVARGEAEDGSDLADVPAAAVTIQFRKDIRGRGYLEARAGLFDRDDHPGPTEKETPGLAVFDAGAGWRIADGTEIRLLVRNLLDHEYPASADENAAIAPGRSALLTVSTSFGR